MRKEEEEEMEKKSKSRRELTRQKVSTNRRESSICHEMGDLYMEVVGKKR